MPATLTSEEIQAAGLSGIAFVTVHSAYAVALPNNDEVTPGGRFEGLWVVQYCDDGSAMEGDFHPFDPSACDMDFSGAWSIELIHGRPSMVIPQNYG